MQGSVCSFEDTLFHTFRYEHTKPASYQTLFRIALLYQIILSVLALNCSLEILWVLGQSSLSTENRALRREDTSLFSGVYFFVPLS